MSRTILVVATVLLAGALPRPAVAQTTGQLVGRVLDARSEAPLEGAEVSLDQRRTLTNGAGDFVFIGVSPGRHVVAVRIPGYTPRSVTVNIEAGVTLTIRVALQSGVVLEDIRVEATQIPLLTPDVASTRQTLTGADLATSPISDIRQALELRTGITDGHFRGGRSGQETYVVDGIDTRNQFAQSQGALAFEVAPSAIQEVSVFTSGFTADQPSALSGVVNVVTRSGPSDRWIGRVELTTDAMMPNSTRRGYGRMGLSAGGPLIGPITMFTDFLLFAGSDREPRVRGVTCVEAPQFDCPVERTIIPHQGGDRYLSLIKLDLPVGSAGGLALSVQRNRDQHELYSTRFKYGLENYLAEREVATLVALTGRGSLQPTRARAILLSGRAAWGRIDRRLGVLAPDQPGRLGYLQPGNYVFRGEDYTRTPVAEQIASGQTIPGYLMPSDSGFGSPWGLFGADLFVTDGTSNIATWTLSDFVQFRGDIQALVSPQHDLRIGGELKLFQIESYQHVLAGVPGALPSYVQFTPKTYAIWFHNTLHAAEAATIDLGVRLEGFQPQLTFPEDRNDPTGVTRSTNWSLLVHPRIGFAMPLGLLGLDRAAFRWNFGRFSQPPDFQFFFDQALDDSLNTSLRRQGNPNLSFERAIQYEAGLDYLITTDLVVRFTGFYKDLTALSTSGIAVGGIENRFTNLDFGFVGGLEMRIEYRPGGPSRFELGYALQKAAGTVSTAFDSVTTDSRSLEQLEIPLQFDRRHAINLTAWTQVRRVDVSLGASVMSGVPAPDDARRRLPWVANVSGRLGWSLASGSRSRLRVFAEGRNLLNFANLIAERAGGGVTPDLNSIETQALAWAQGALPIPRESPWYLARLDLDNDGLLSQSEQILARRGALLDAAEPTLLYGEARQVRVGLEITW
ncbi:MAG: TonB-dependent receptor [Gemmatimonadales bacterium]